MAETNAETDFTEHAQLAGALADARHRIAELEALAAERSHAQEESRQDQRLYRELFEDSLGLMCVHDLDGVLLIVNPAAAQSLGFRPEEGVGVNMKRFLAPAVRPLFDAYLDRIRPESLRLRRMRSGPSSTPTWIASAAIAAIRGFCVWLRGTGTNASGFTGTFCMRSLARRRACLATPRTSASGWAPKRR